MIQDAGTWALQPWGPMMMWRRLSWLNDGDCSSSWGFFFLPVQINTTINLLLTRGCACECACVCVGFIGNFHSSSSPTVHGQSCISSRLKDWTCCTDLSQTPSLQSCSCNLPQQRGSAARNSQKNLGTGQNEPLQRFTPCLRVKTTTTQRETPSLLGPVTLEHHFSCQSHKNPQTPPFKHPVWICVAAPKHLQNVNRLSCSSIVIYPITFGLKCNHCSNHLRVILNLRDYRLFSSNAV